MTNPATIEAREASKEENLESLEFLKIRIPENVRLIPKELIEGVKGRTFSPEQFYHYQEEWIENPANLLYVLIDSSKKIEGYLWAEISQMDRSMFINTFSISKEYWHKGEAIPRVIAFLDKLKSKHECPRVFWVTTNPKFFEKHNFKRSKNVLMEYNQN